MEVFYQDSILLERNKMVNILGMEIGTGLGWGLLLQVLYTIGILIITSIIIVFVVKWWKNKTIFITPVRLVRYLENGTKKEMNGLRGGKVKNSNGVADFAVKIPKKFRKHFLGYMPDYSKADADGRLVFIVVGDGTLWQQIIEKLQTHEKLIYRATEEEKQEVIENYREAIERNFKNKSAKEKEKVFNDLMIKWLQENGEKEIEKELIMKPIPTDVKTVTVNNLQGWRAVLDRQKLTAFGIAIGGFIIMVIAHLVSLYIQTKIKCPAIP